MTTKRTKEENAKEPAPLLNWVDEVLEESNPIKKSKQTDFVEAHIDGIGKVKIPVSALTEQLKGLKIEDERKVAHWPEPDTN